MMSATAVPDHTGLCISSQTLEFGGGVSLHNANTLIFGF